MTFALSAKIRQGKTEQIRASGLIPAVLYGPEIEAQPVSVDYRSFEKLYQAAGESNLVDLSIEGKNSAKVLIQEVQTDPVKGTIIHADFRQINMNKPMTASIQLQFVGESAAMKELGGTLIKGPQTIRITCLPKDLIGSVDVNLSVLKTFDDVVHISDLVLPAGIVVEDSANIVVAKVAPPLTEDQLKAMEESTAPSIEDIEVEKKGKTEEEGEGDAEGGAPAAEKKEDKAEKK